MTVCQGKESNGVLVEHELEPDQIRRFYSRTNSHNTAGCVTNIQYTGSNYSLNIGLAWNSQYQLTAVATNGVECERNGYDALGRRAWSWDAGQTNFFVYAGVQVIADLNSTGGLVRSYTWGPGIDNLLAMTVYTGATVKTYFALITCDHGCMQYRLLHLCYCKKCPFMVK